MSIRSVARMVFVPSFITLTTALGFSADNTVPLPSRTPVLTVTLKTNEVYYLDEYKTDIDRLESGLSGISGQKISLASKDKLGILLDTVDWMLFRQYCESENIRVSDNEVSDVVEEGGDCQSFGPRHAARGERATESEVYDPPEVGSGRDQRQAPRGRQYHGQPGPALRHPRPARDRQAQGS